MKIKKFKDLNIWQRGIELVEDIYQTTDQFPKNELYNLTSQMRRSAVSVPSNIAEGFRRHHSKEFKQFLNITLGSLAELETQIIIANNRKYLKKDRNDEICEKIDILSRMTYNLHRKL